MHNWFIIILNETGLVFIISVKAETPPRKRRGVLFCNGNFFLRRDISSV